MVSTDELATFCKQKGFVFPNSDIYGGFSGFYDFGPLGVELKNNIKTELWKSFVQSRSDVVGIDGSIISHPKVWDASGHTKKFSDAIVTCPKCGFQDRADTLIEEKLKINVEGKTPTEIQQVIDDNKLLCHNCKEPLKVGSDFNLMFSTSVGAAKPVTSYLRPETAQLIFTNFKNIIDTQRVKLPFGIAQIGKAFRNEISPRDFLFRTREFEQFEIEFFCHPKKLDECPYFDEMRNFKMNVLTEAAQKNNKEATPVTLISLYNNKVFKTKWHAYWVAIVYKWFLDHRISEEHIRIREHLKDELAHYASACFDIEYKFPTGWKEIHGSADRSDFDLKQHSEFSKKDQNYHDEEAKEKIIPFVAAEPSQGIERAMLAFMFDAFDNNKERGNIVLHLDPRIAPIKIGVFPLVNKLTDEAMKVFDLLKDKFVCTFDKGGSIGRRYARADEQGIPYCITVDFDTLKDQTVTVRDRETTDQKRIEISELRKYLHKKLN